MTIVLSWLLVVGCSSADPVADGPASSTDGPSARRDTVAADAGLRPDSTTARDGVAAADTHVALDSGPGADMSITPRGWPLNTGFIVAVDAQEGGTILAAKDAYVRSTSAFDRSFLTQTVGNVSVDQLAAHLGQQAGDWTSDERTRLQAAVAAIHQRMQGYELPFPRQMFLIKGQGFMPSHTRGAAVYLGSEGLLADASQLQELLTHELFHVLSRNAPSVREQLYGVIDFHPCGVVERPTEIADLWLTNPDALDQYCVELSYGGYTYDFMPVTYAKAAYSSNTGTDLFSVMDFAFLGVQAGTSTSVPLYRNGGAGDLLLVAPQYVQQEYMQKVGNNTDYIIHPDEIVADNFAALFTGKQNLPSPQITQGIDALLAAL